MFICNSFIINQIRSAHSTGKKNTVSLKQECQKSKNSWKLFWSIPILPVTTKVNKDMDFHTEKDQTSVVFRIVSNCLQHNQVRCVNNSHL